MRLSNRLDFLTGLCALVLFATIDLARAAEPTASDRQISGVVVNRDGRLVAGVKVRTRLLGELKTTITDNDGGFAFDSPPGLDFLRIVASTDDGKEQCYFQQDLSTVGDGMAPPAIRLTLEPAVEFGCMCLTPKESQPAARRSLRPSAWKRSTSKPPTLTGNLCCERRPMPHKQTALT